MSCYQSLLRLKTRVVHNRHGGTVLYYDTAMQNRPAASYTSNYTPYMVANGNLITVARDYQVDITE